MMMENVMATAKKTVKKKTQAEKLAFHLEAVKRIKADLASNLERSAPGVDKLVAAFDEVCEKNNCKALVVIKSLSKFKHLGLTFTTPKRKPRKAKAGTTRQGSTRHGQLSAVA